MGRFYLGAGFVRPGNVDLMNRAKEKTMYFSLDVPKDDLTSYFARFCGLDPYKGQKKAICLCTYQL